MTKNEVKWAGFQRNFARTSDRDPWPNAVFVEPAPIMTQWEKWLYGIAAALVMGSLLFGGYFGWAW